MIRIASLHVYPLKGGRGIELERVVLDQFGPRNDRRWMVVDARGRVVTQREVPRLCQVAAIPTQDRLTLSAPGAPDLVVARPCEGSSRMVTVWGDTVAAVDVGADAGGWCRDFLGEDVGLVYLPDDTRRRTDPSYDPVGGWVSFADGYPILLAGTASLVDLNRRLERPLPMNRFRPNVVVSGTAPFAEDSWRRFTIGGVPFDAVKPCARCVVTTTDQATGERSVEPLRTLAKFRKQGSGVMFGVNVVHRAAGTLAVGDEVILPGPA